MPRSTVHRDLHGFGSELAGEPEAIRVVDLPVQHAPELVCFGDGSEFAHHAAARHIVERGDEALQVPLLVIEAEHHLPFHK